jgi:hypothetical protein
MNIIGLNINLFIRIFVDTKQIKPGSSTILILNYLGMRKRIGRPWASDLEIASFFPHKFQRRSAKAADVRTALKHMLKANYVNVKDIKGVSHYSATSLGASIPYEVAHRVANSPTYQSRLKNEDYN